MSARKFSLWQKWQLLQLILASKKVRSSAKVIAAKLLDHLNTETGRCFPSYNTLGAGVGLGRRTAMNGVRDLERAGFLARRRNSRGGRQTSNEIVFNWDLVPDGKGTEADR